MNPRHVMVFIACCTALFALVVTSLVLQGVPLPLALLGVYLVAVASMLGMQWRARMSYEGSDRSGRRTDGVPPREPSAGMTTWRSGGFEA